MKRNDTYEVFAELYDAIKRSDSIETVIEEWGGVNLTVPGFIGAVRERAICRELDALPKDWSVRRKIQALSRRFGLNSTTIRRTLAKCRGETGLFAVEGGGDE